MKIASKVLNNEEVELIEDIDITNIHKFQILIKELNTIQSY